MLHRSFRYNVRTGSKKFVPVPLSRECTIDRLEDRRLFSTAYGLVGASGTLLAKFDTTAPGPIQVTAISGLQTGETIRGIDFRPATGQLYALGITSTAGDDEGRIYTINTTTGAATQVGASPFSTTLTFGAQYGFDFNPQVDRIRVVNDADQNLGVNPNNGALSSTNFALNNPADDEEVTAAAYDRNVSGTAATTLFGLDFINDNLVRIGGVDGGAPEGPPSDGVVTTIGPLGITTSTAANGFDIAQDGTAYATLTDQATGTSGLYTIDLTTGEATLVGNIGNGAEVVRGLAVAPDNFPPIANTDNYVATQNTPLAVAAPGVLGNDTDPENDSLTATKVTDPVNGTVVFNPNGSFTYTPNPGYLGPDSFTYSASDGTSTSFPATVNINVVPDVPSAMLGPDPGEPTKIALIVKGTNDPNFIDFGKGSSSSKLKVKVDGVSLGEFNNSAFGRIYVFAKGGDDTVAVTTSTTKTSLVFGGTGNDNIKGGYGTDVLVGEAGFDILSGRKGRDVIIGGADSDGISGDEDDDLLIGASTIYDNDYASLLAILKEWTSSHSYSSRVSNLQNGSSNAAGRKLNDANILEDGAADILSGGSSRDAYFVEKDGGPGFFKDTITDKKSDETSVDID